MHIKSGEKETKILILTNKLFDLFFKKAKMINDSDFCVNFKNYKKLSNEIIRCLVEYLGDNDLYGKIIDKMIYQYSDLEINNKLYISSFSYSKMVSEIIEINERDFLCCI